MYKTTVGWLKRANWKKKIHSSNQKYCTPSKLQIEIKKIDKNVKFDYLFLRNS